jgi:phosphoglycerate kinase
LLDKVDTLLVGGAMSYAFVKAQGLEVGTSYFKAEDAPIAGELLQVAKEGGKDFRLPTDFIVADRDAEDAQTAVVPFGGVPADKMGMDIGPATVDEYSKVLKAPKPCCGTALWDALK